MLLSHQRNSKQPSDHHLPNLRAQLYDQILPYQIDKQEDYFKEIFVRTHDQRLSFEFEVKQEDILPLLTMPH